MLHAGPAPLRGRETARHRPLPRRTAGGDRNDTPQIDDIDAAEELFPGRIPPGTAKELSARNRETLRRLYALPVGMRIGGPRRAY